MAQSQANVPSKEPCFQHLFLHYLSLLCTLHFNRYSNTFTLSFSAFKRPSHRRYTCPFHTFSFRLNHWDPDLVLTKRSPMLLNRPGMISQMERAMTLNHGSFSPETAHSCTFTAHPRTFHLLFTICTSFSYPLEIFFGNWIWSDNQCWTFKTIPAIFRTYLLNFFHSFTTLRIRTK